MDIHGGEFVAIMGPSGSGKSTAMNILGFLDKPTSGSYLFGGAEVDHLERDQLALLRRNYLGFVFQGYNLLARTSALDNVELPLIYQGMPRTSAVNCRWRRLKRSAWRRASTTILPSFQEASNNAWRSPARS
jgi:putative ABC transport system ATP-binding protein